MTFSIRATHNGRHTWLAQGDKINLEFEDGKGVSGRIGDVNVESGGSSFSIIVTHDGLPLTERPHYTMTPAGDVHVHWRPDAGPETAADEAQDADGSNDPTPGERDLLDALRLKSQAAEDLGHKVEALIRENARLGRDRGVIQDTLNSRARQLERSRAQHDEKNEKIAELERQLADARSAGSSFQRQLRKAQAAVNVSAADVAALRASLRDLGNDYQAMHGLLEQERTQKDRHWQAIQGQREALSEMRQQRDDARAEIELLRAEKQKKVGAVDQTRGTFRTAIHPGSINFYGEPSTQQVLAARERPRQRVVTEHEQDGSVTIRVELREGN